MGKFDGILIVSDLDGTLLNNRSQLSQKNRDAIAYFEAEGGAFSYISGRVARCLRPILEMMTPSVPVGANNGMLYDANAGEWVDFEALSPDAVRLTNDVVEALPDAGVVVMGKRHVWFSRRDPIGDRFRSIVGLSERYEPLEQIPEEYCKVLFTYPADRFEELRRVVDTHPLSAQFELVRSDAKYYEVMPKGCNKGRALTALAKHLGISPARTIAVGDQENDIAMFRAAALGIAVANASAVAKEAADLVLNATNEDGAIAAIVDQLDRGELHI